MVLVPPMAWWKVLLHLVIHQVQPSSHIYIRPHYYKLDMLDNPAIEALIQYKWSLYNYLDLLAFLFPLATSMNQMMNISRQDPGGATWDLSFSIIIIFLHMISELRVFPGICRYVTIIIRAFVEIRVFFMVFAFGILTFALAIQHVLRGCASKGNGDGNGCSKGSATAFPKDFWEAITSTYLIMGGRYDPVSKELSDTPNAPLQAMVVIYFFFTVILMLNVLIALINGGFDLGSSHWRLVWLENRLRYVESAEEMSYHVPGFRESRDWFPREIYYVATKVDSDNYASQIKESKEVEDILEGRMHESDEKMMEMGGEMDDNFTKLSDEISEVTSEILGLSEVVALIQRSLTERKDSTRVGDDHSEEEDENAKGHGNIMEASEPTKTSGEEKSGLFNNEVSAVWDGGNEENSMSGVIKKGVLKSVDRSSSTTQQTYQQQDGSNGNSARAEDQYDQKALLQLRAQVDDLIKKQDETYQHNVRLEEMLARVVKKLGD
ncbi:hypothetical protein BGZ83_011867 [Gryganskiella cystojenkinii]|nr:hypothetical protein BGZ83_011867 [Gryganskiella cystojenkinii]